MKPIDFDDRAIREARRAQRWYARRSTVLSHRFKAELEKTIVRAKTSPSACSPHVDGTRKTRIRKFPYWLVFLEESNRILIISVMHVRRKEGYWKKRIPRTS